MDQGRLDVEIDWNGSRVTGAVIHHRRPDVAELLAGRIPEEALTVVARLYGVCRQGHSAAMRMALEMASRGDAAAPAPVAIAVEAAQEHLWRLLLDWPRLLGLRPAEKAFAEAYRRLGAVAERGCWGADGPVVTGICETELFGMPVEAWLESLRRGVLGGALLEEIVAAMGTDEPAPAWPRLLPGGLQAAECFDDLPANFGSDFAREPTWQSRPAETGPLARWAGVLRKDGAGTGLSTMALRIWARAAELAVTVAELAGRLPPRPRCDGFSPEPGCGFAAVETSRGLLVHGVQMRQGRIARYHIIAPAEWNFHPEGSFVREMVGQVAASREQIEVRAQRLLLALDPGLPGHITIRDVGGF